MGDSILLAAYLWLGCVALLAVLANCFAVASFRTRSRRTGIYLGLALLSGLSSMGLLGALIVVVR